MDRLELAVMRGEQAQALRTNPLYEQAFADTRKAILEAWAALPSRDIADREHAQDLHRMLKCLDRVRKCVDTHVDTGRLAQKEIEGRSRLSTVFRRA